MRRLYAIAGNTITQGLKMKVALIIAAFLLITIPLLPILVKSDGTIKGQAQLILTYTLNIASFLLYILAAFLSTAALTGDLKNKQICVIDITPARRWEVLAGKWLGVVILCAGLLAVIGAAIYSLTKITVKPSSEQEQKILRQEVFTARTRLQPRPQDIEVLTGQYYETLTKQGLIKTEKGSPEEKQVLAQIRQFCQKYPYTVMPRTPRYWEFNGLPLPDNQEAAVAIRYKLNASQTTSDGAIQCLWHFGSPADRNAPQVMTKDQEGSFHEFLVPASIITADGSLTVGFVCLEDTSIMFDKDKGLEILYKSGSFEVNFIKGLFLILAKIGFIAAIGICTGTFLTFPVAALSVFFITGLAYMAGPMSWILNLSKPGYGAQPLSQGALTRIMWYLLKFIIPDFSRYSGIGQIASGEDISALGLLESIGVLNIIYAALLLLLAAAIFARKEIADIN